MCQIPFSPSSLLLALLELDRAEAALCRGVPCLKCGSQLHQANYPRKPRGPALENEGPALRTRFSFCCGQCRRRLTPPSARFLGRRMYWGWVVIFVSALAQGPSPWTYRQVQRQFGIARKTLKRWADWWRYRFPRTGFWRYHRGSSFDLPPDEDTLPISLLRMLQAGTWEDQLLNVLRFLLPITGGNRMSPLIKVSEG